MTVICNCGHEEGDPVVPACPRCGAARFEITGPSTVTITDDKAHPPALVWWSRDGAELGTPWRVRHHDGTCELFRAVRIEGVVDFIHPEPPIPDLPDGPRAVAVLIAGTLIGGR